MRMGGMRGRGSGWGRAGGNGGRWSGGAAPTPAAGAAVAHATARRRAAAVASAAAATAGEASEAQRCGEPVRVRGGGSEEEQLGSAGTVVMSEAVPAHTEMEVNGTVGGDGMDYEAGALRKWRFGEAEQDMQAHVAVEVGVPADEVVGTVGREMEGYNRRVGGATAGLAVGTVTGPEQVPGMATRIPCDAYEENRKKTKK